VRNHIIFVVLAVTMMASISSAQWAGNVSTDVLTQYICVNGQTGYTKPVQQTNLFAAHPSGLYIDGWFSFPHSGMDNNGREIDAFIGYSQPSYEVGFGYFLVEPLSKIKGDVWYPYAKVAVGSIFSTTFWMEATYVGLVDDPANNGFLGQAYAKYATSGIITSFGEVTHTCRAGVMYDSGIFQRNAGLLAIYQGDLQWKLGPTLLLRAPTVKWFIPLTDSDVKNDAMVGAGLTYSF
jgi:hypothetical protein